MSSDLIEARRGANATVPQDIEWSKFGNRTFQCRVLICPEEDGGYSAHAIRLPGVVSQGETVDEAIANVRDACQGAIQAYLEAGNSVPWVQDDSLDRPKGSLERWILVNA
jgi:antitoxin HicB